MALFEIGKTRISLKLQQNNKIYELAVLGEITLTREINKASKLTCTVLRDAITPELFNTVALTIDEQHNQFYGYILETNKSGNECQITCYDQLYYLNMSPGEEFIYSNKTASEIAYDLGTRYNFGVLNPPAFLDTGYKIDYLIGDNISCLEMIQKAFDITEEYTGQKFFIWDDFGSLTITDQAWLAGEINLIASMGYLEDYNYVENTEGYYNKIIINQDLNFDEYQGTINLKYILDNHRQNIEGLIPTRYDMDKEDNIPHAAKQILQNHSDYNREMHITGCQGDITVRGGSPVPVDFFTVDNKERIKGWFECQSVTHHITNHHTMDLELKLIKMDIDNNNFGPQNYGVTITQRFIPPQDLTPETPKGREPGNY